MCLIITTHATGLRILTQIHLHEEKSLAAKMNKDTLTKKNTWKPIDVHLCEKIQRDTVQSY